MPQYQNPAALLGLARDMIEKGWQPVWCPLRSTGSHTPLPGLTGSAPFPSVLAQPSGAHHLALRPPPEIVLFDVDHYDDKRGMDTMDAAEERLGDLPYTYRITARGFDNPSGRYMYRKPTDLEITDSALSIFGEDGVTSVEIVRTGHRFSWAPGDFHYKTDTLIECFNPDWDADDLPYVDEVPYLPDRWVEFLRNPPVSATSLAFQKPSDGPEWWLSVPDDSLTTDAELSQFAFDLMMSRLPMEAAFEQWQRVSRAAVSSWEWDYKDFERHTRTRAQGKVAQALANEDASIDDALALDERAFDKYDVAKREYENPIALTSLMTTPDIAPTEDQLLAFQPLLPVADDTPAQSRADKAEEIIRSDPRYNELFFRAAAREVIDRDISDLFSEEFSGYVDISDLPEPPPAAHLSVTGSGYVVPPGTVTVLSGNRASGKTWTSATWAAQEMRRGNHVFWIDFERQAHLLASKLRVLGIQPHVMKDLLHFIGSAIPDIEFLTADIRRYGHPLVVVDAFRGLQNTLSPGSSANDGDAVEAVYLKYVNPLTEAGATVALIDHLPKGGTSTFGSERKESAADYVIRVEQHKPFARAVAGYSVLTVTKDRYGIITAGSVIAALWVPVAGTGKPTPTLEGKTPEEIQSIREYPDIPELRSWSPDGDGTLEQFADGGSPQGTARNERTERKLERQAAIIDLVAANPLRFGQRQLARTVTDLKADLFDTEEAVRAFLRSMVSEGLLLVDGGKKYSIPEYELPDAPSSPAGNTTDLVGALHGETEHDDNDSGEGNDDD